MNQLSKYQKNKQENIKAKYANYGSANFFLAFFAVICRALQELIPKHLNDNQKSFTNC